MRVPDFPDNEARRRYDEMKRVMPSESQMRAIEQARQLQNLTSLPQQAEQIRLFMQAIAGRGTEFYQAMQHFQQGMNALAKNFVQPLMNSEVMRFLANAKANERVASAYFANSLRGGEIVEAIKQIQASIPLETIVNIGNAFVHMNDGPIRAAMETMRNLNLENAGPAFNEFVEDALQQPEPLTKKSLERVKKAHLSKKKVSRLSPNQQFWTMVGIQLLGVFIMWFQLIQAGKPIRLDPDQLAKLNQPQINITNIFQAMYPSEPVSYLVMRDCELVSKPGKTRGVIYTLSPGTKVKLILTNHHWIYVHYEDGNMTKEGWVRKKYLRRLPA